MALKMLDGAAGALRKDDDDEFKQDEEKAKRTLIGPDIPGTRKILPEHMPMGGLAPADGTLIGGRF
jgi:hypothetical protein